MILAAGPNFLTIPGISAKWAIGSVALFHTAVASLAIGFAFIVTVLQIIGYRRRSNGYDLLAKRIQLWHVCVYNVGTINAIGLVFLLSGLYPQFWSQIFVHFFWPMIVEELCFFLLATTVTLHYFFWDRMWGHKKLHIFLGSLLTPLFFFQFYLINGMGGFMLTPGVAKATVSQWQGTAGITGWDKTIFYNPSFLMLTFHRTLANFSYGAFVAAGVCGIMLYLHKHSKIRRFYEDGGRMAFQVAFICLLSLPIIGYFYAWVLKYSASEAYVNLMWGRGDVVAGGIDWWWTKHVIVAAMVGMGLYHQWRSGREGKDFALPAVLVLTIAAFYVIYYAAMGMIMTWFFFVVMLGVGLLAAGVGRHLLARHEGSGRALFTIVGILSFLTVMLGGYVREASRPRFTAAAVGPASPAQEDPNRYAHYDDVYLPRERQSAGGGDIVMTTTRPKGIPIRPDLAGLPVEPSQMTPADLISEKCSTCHTLQRIRIYRLTNWPTVVHRMRAYGTRLTNEEATKITEHLQAGKPF